MATRIDALSIAILPAQPQDGPSILHRLHTWLTDHASAGAAAWSDAAGAIHAACRLTRPTRLTRAKWALSIAVCGSADVLHVKAAADARAACARVIDGAGGLAFTPPPRTSAVIAPTGRDAATEGAAEAKVPTALLLHGLTVADVLAGRHTAWSVQRGAGVLRSLPLSGALEAVRARVDASSMLPVHHACESPDVLAERFSRPERLSGIATRDLQYVPSPSCPLCWRNEHLREELGPGHVRAAIPALYAAGYDAGHLLLRHAEHGLARAVTDLVVLDRRRAQEPRRPRRGKRKRQAHEEQ
jgi:hypothetical protein